MPNDVQKIELAKQIMAYMVEHKYTTRNRLTKEFNVSRQKLDKLEEDGYIERLPLRLNASQAGSMARKTSGWGDNFYLRGSPRNKEMKHG